MKKYETTSRELIQRGLKLPLMRSIYQWSDSLELAMTRREAEKLANAYARTHPHGGNLCH
jgi:hypothetical protein